MSASPRSQIASASGPFSAVTTSKYSAESFASSSFTLVMNIVDDQNAR